MSLKLQGNHFEKPDNSSWIKKEVLRGPFGNFEVLNGPVLLKFFRTGPKGPAVRWYTRARVIHKLREQDKVDRLGGQKIPIFVYVQGTKCQSGGRYVVRSKKGQNHVYLVIE